MKTKNILSALIAAVVAAMIGSRGRIAYEWKRSGGEKYVVAFVISLILILALSVVFYPIFWEWFNFLIAS